MAVVLVSLFLAAALGAFPAGSTRSGHPAGIGPGGRAAFLPLTGTNFSLRFNETGLPVGTNWSVNLNGSSNWSVGPTVGFLVPNGTYPFTIGSIPGWVPAPTQGNVSVSGATASVTVTFSAFTFPLTFSEVGLPLATPWQVVVNGTDYNTSTSSATIAEPNGTFSFVVTSVPGFTSSPVSGNTTVLGHSQIVPVTFSPVLYNVSFAESGLPSGTNWSVNLSGAIAQTNLTTLLYQEPNGTWVFAVERVPGYTAAPGSGSVTVNGSAVLENITFTPIPPNRYVVTFNETGLTAGTNWSVKLNGTPSAYSTGPSIAFTVTNGSYNYTLGLVPGYRAAVPSGNVTVSGAVVLVNVTFTVVRYAVNFSESGLPPGTNWSFVVAGKLRNASGPWLLVDLANGTHPFTVSPVSGYVASPPSGTVNVTGGRAHLAITFTPFTFLVAWPESGLPGGTNWSVTLGGKVEWTTTTQLTFAEPNGTYGFQIPGVPGFLPRPATGTVTINGSGLVETVAFSPGLFSVAFTESGLPSGTAWWVVLAGQNLSTESDTVDFSEANGSFGFSISVPSGYRVTAPSGGVGLVHVVGVNQTVSVSFAPVIIPGSYAVNFTESGLPAGTAWNVSLNGSVVTSRSTELSFVRENGSYPFTVGALTGFNDTPASGLVTVNGSGTTVSIAFTAHTPPAQQTVVFEEQGLPTGTAWTLTLAGNVMNVTSSSVSLKESPGVYSYSIQTRGYSASPPSGNVTVAAAPVQVLVSFTALGGSVPTPGPAPAVLAVPTLVYLGAMGGLIVVAVGIASSTRDQRVPGGDSKNPR